MEWLKKYLRKIHLGKAIAFTALGVAGAALLCGLLDSPFSIAIIAFYWGAMADDLLR